MQRVVIEEPYKFVAPHRGRWLPILLRPLGFRYLRKSHGIVEGECRSVERLKASLAAGYGVVLTPNHCRPCDPFSLCYLSREIGKFFYIMASWHVFKQDMLTRIMIRSLGAFSIYREGMDRSALNFAAQALERAERPVVLFPEGVISRANDRLGPLLEGTAFIARTAAKRGMKVTPQRKVVVHPIALRYVFLGDIDQAISGFLGELEARLSWSEPVTPVPLLERIARIGEALLCLKEIEFLGKPRSGPVYDRLQHLVEHLLVPKEEEWLGGRQDGDVAVRYKKLRMAILPDMVDGKVDEAERARRWRHLADLYLAQQLAFYPRDYINVDCPPERLLETAERFEEDLTDVARVHGPLKVVLEVGEAIEVSPRRDRKAEVDPLMQAIEDSLKAMLKNLGEEYNGRRGGGG